MKTVWLIAVRVGFLVVVYSLRVERWRAENIINLFIRCVSFLSGVYNWEVEVGPTVVSPRRIP